MQLRFLYIEVGYIFQTNHNKAGLQLQHNLENKDTEYKRYSFKIKCASQATGTS